MAGNSKRRGAIRKDGTKKGMVVGSGGQRRRALEGKGPTPPAEMRPGHPAAAARPAARGQARGARRGDRGRPAAADAAGDGETPETVLGRNPVVECLRAGVPATALHVALGATADERVAEAVHLAADAGHLDPRGAAQRPGPDRRRRAAPGRRAAGAAVRVRPPRRAAGGRRRVGRARADRRAGRGHRPAQPRRGRALGRRVRRARRGGAAAPLGRHDGGRLAHLGRHGRAAAGGPGHQPDPHAARVRHGRAHDRRPGRRGLGVASTSSSWPPTRWCW